MRSYAAPRNPSRDHDRSGLQPGLLTGVDQRPLIGICLAAQVLALTDQPYQPLIVDVALHQQATPREAMGRLAAKQVLRRLDHQPVTQRQQDVGFTLMIGLST